MSIEWWKKCKGLVFLMTEIVDLNYSAIKNIPDLLEVLRQKDISSNLYWIYVEKYQERKARENGIPLYGQFELTPLCNLDCKMCYVHLNAEQLKGRQLLTTEDWKGIMYQARSMGMLYATLTGGECLIYPGFDELYMFLRSLGVKISIKTNGVLLNKERIDFFNKYLPRDVTISLYGSSNDAYYNVTGHSVFDIVYGNLQLLKGANFPIHIGITPSRYMYDDIEGLLQIVNDLHFPLLMNIALFPPREETGRNLCDLTAGEYLEIFKLLREKAGSQNNLYEYVEEPDINNLDKKNEKREASRFGLQCGAGRSFLTINWKGDMSGCDNLESLRINVLDKSFAYAWRLIHSEALTYPLPVECNYCEYSKECLNCAAYRGDRKSPGHCNKSVCERTRIFYNN